MTTVETAKAIRAELKATFPGVKFQVRKSDVGVINIDHDNNKDLASAVQHFCRKFEDWNTYNVNYVFVNYYGTL